MDNRLNWHKDNEKHYTGFEDGAAWGWVYLGEDDTWWWETDCTEDGTTQYTSGFATAEDAKSAADAAYGEWIENLGDPFEDMVPIDFEEPAQIGSHCDIYGYCPYGCKIGDSRCTMCPVYTEDDDAHLFDDVDWEDDDE